jgi:hypothetical protein
MFRAGTSYTTIQRSQTSTENTPKVLKTEKDTESQETHETGHLGKMNLFLGIIWELLGVRTPLVRVANMVGNNYGAAFNCEESFRGLSQSDNSSQDVER